MHVRSYCQYGKCPICALRKGLAALSPPEGAYFCILDGCASASRIPPFRGFGI